MKIKFKKEKVTFFDHFKAFSLGLLVTAFILVLGIEGLFGSGLVGLQNIIILIILGNFLVIMKIRRDRQKKPLFTVTNRREYVYYRKFAILSLFCFVIALSLFFYADYDLRTDQQVGSIRTEGVVSEIAEQIKGECWKFHSNLSRMLCARNEVYMLGHELIDYKQDEWLNEWILIDNDPDTALARGTGDCDDRAVFYASVMKKLGFQSYIVMQKQHLCASVYMDDEMYFIGCADFEAFPLLEVRRV